MRPPACCPAHPAVNSPPFPTPQNRAASARPPGPPSPAAGGGYVNLGPAQSGQGPPPPALPVLSRPGDQEITRPRRPARARSTPTSPAAASAAGLPELTAIDEGRRRAVAVGAARLPEHPAAAAVLPGRDRRRRGRWPTATGCGGAPLVRAGRTRDGKDHLVLGSVHLRLAADRPRSKRR